MDSTPPLVGALVLKVPMLLSFSKEGLLMIGGFTFINVWGVAYLKTSVGARVSLNSISPTLHHSPKSPCIHGLDLDGCSPGLFVPDCRFGDMWHLGMYVGQKAHIGMSSTLQPH